MGTKFEIRGHPVDDISAVNPEGIDLDVEPRLVITVDRNIIQVKKSGQITGKLKEKLRKWKYVSGEE